MNNAPHDMAGLDDPARRWLDKLVTVESHPEWGAVRILRWFPPSGDGPERLRVFSGQMRAPHLVTVHEVRIVEERSEV